MYHNRSRIETINTDEKRKEKKVNRKQIWLTILVSLALCTVVGVYAGTVGVNDLFGFTNGYGFTDLNSTNVNAGTEFYRGGFNYTQFIELLIPNHDQDINTTDAVTFASVNATVEYYRGPLNYTTWLLGKAGGGVPFDQDLNTTDPVQFQGVEVGWVDLNGDNRTTWPTASGSLLSYNYVLTLSAGSVTAYKNDGTNFTTASDIDAFTWAQGNLTNGGSIYIKASDDGAPYVFTVLPWNITNNNIRITGDNPIITATPDLIRYARDFPNPDWPLIYVTASNVEIDHLVLFPNGQTQTGNIPGDLDEKGSAICAYNGTGGLFSAGMLAAQTEKNLYLHDLAIQDSYEVGVFIMKYDNIVLENIDFENVYTEAAGGRKALVLSWVDGGIVDKIRVVLNTTGTYHGSSNCLFYIRATNNPAYSTGVKNVITTNFYLEGSIDSSIEQLGGPIGNPNFNNIFDGGIIRGRGCYTSQNGYNCTFSDITMYYCGGTAGTDTGAGGFNAGHNAGAPNTQYIRDIVFDNCWVYLVNGSLREGFRHVSNGANLTDITIKNCGVVLPEDYIATDTARGIFIDGSSEAAPAHTTRFVIENFYCNSVGPGVEIDGTVAESKIWIRNSQFINMGQPDAGDYYGVKHDGAGWVFITDNVFFDEIGYMDYGVDITSTADGKFLNNLVNCTLGLRLGANAGNWTVAWDDFTGCTTSVTDNGADRLVYGDNVNATGLYETEGA